MSSGAPPRQDATKPAQPPVIGRAKSSVPPSGPSKQAQLQTQGQGQGQIQQGQAQGRRSHDHTLGIETMEGDPRRASSVNLTSNHNSNGNGRPGEAQPSALSTAMGRSSVAPQSATHANYPTGSPQISSSPGAQPRLKSPFAPAHSAPPTPTMSPPMRVGKDPRSPAATSPTDGTAAMWKGVDFNGHGPTNHAASIVIPTQTLAATSPVGAVQSFTTCPAPTLTPTSGGRPSTPSSSPSSTSTYQITPNGYVIFGTDARSQQVRRDLQDLLPILLPGLTLNTEPAAVAESEAQLMRLSESLAVALQMRFYLLQVLRGNYSWPPVAPKCLPMFNEEMLKLVWPGGGQQRNGAADVAPGSQRERKRTRRGTVAGVPDDGDAMMSNGNGDGNGDHQNGDYTAAAAADAAAAAAAGTPGGGPAGGGAAMSLPASFYPDASGGETSFRRM